MNFSLELALQLQSFDLNLFKRASFVSQVELALGAGGLTSLQLLLQLLELVSELAALLIESLCLKHVSRLLSVQVSCKTRQLYLEGISFACECVFLLKQGRFPGLKVLNTTLHQAILLRLHRHLHLILAQFRVQLKDLVALLV